MTTIVSGNGLGLLNTSLYVLGPQGGLGQAAQGQAGEQIYVNARSGNLVVHGPQSNSLDCWYRAWAFHALRCTGSVLHAHDHHREHGSQLTKPPTTIQRRS